MRNRNLIKKLAVATMFVGLIACGDAEDRKLKYMQQGKELFQQQRYDKALLAFKNVLQIDPKDSAARYQLAETLSKQGEIKQAFAHYNAVINADETHVMARVRVGQLYLMSRNIENAEKMILEAFALEPNNNEVLVFQSAVYLLKDNVDAAIKSIDKVLEQTPEFSSAVVMRASIYAKTGDLKQAIELLKQGVLNAADNEAMHVMLAKLYAKQGLTDDVEKELKQLVKIKPDVFHHYNRLVQFYLLDNRLGTAEAVLRDALNEMPDNEGVQLYFIDFLAQKQSVDKAVNELLRFIKLSPEAYYLYFKLADLQASEKDFLSVEATLKQVIDKDRFGASGVKARNVLSRLYLSTERVEQAKELIKIVLAENPRDAEALTLRGQLALSNKEITEAIADFRSALVGQPKNIKLLKLLSSAQLANNDIELAIENTQKVIAIVPSDISARQRLVDLLFHSGKELQAEPIILAILKIDPKNKVALEGLFKVSMIKKEWDEALSAASKIRIDGEDDVNGYYYAGRVYQAQSEWQKSIEAFKQVLLLKPAAVEPLTLLVKSYLLFNQSDKATSYLQGMIKKQPNHFVAYNLMGEVFLYSKNLTDAKVAFQHAIEIKPDWFNAYRNLALLFMIDKDRVAAIKTLRTGVEKTKGAIKLIDLLSTIYKKEGEVDEIIKLYEQAYLYQPNSMVVINNLASYLAEYGGSQGSLERAEKIAKPLEKSTNPYILDTVAWIAFKRGDYDKAQRLFELVIEKGVSSAEVSYHIGMLYFKQGDNELAEIYLKKALSKEAKYEGIDQAKEILQRIQARSLSLKS